MDVAPEFGLVSQPAVQIRCAPPAFCPSRRTISHGWPVTSPRSGAAMPRTVASMTSHGHLEQPAFEAAGAGVLLAVPDIGTSVSVNSVSDRWEMLTRSRASV